MSEISKVSTITIADIINNVQIEGTYWLQVTDAQKNPLFSVTGRDDYCRIRMDATGKLQEQVWQAARIAGIGNITAELTGGTSGAHDMAYSTANKSKFQEWFKIIKRGRIFFADTNVLINRSLSSLRFAIGNESFFGIIIFIPRLSILELERIADEESDKTVKKRLAMAASAEIRHLRRLGGSTLSPLETRIIEGFTANAGKRMTDAWIRHEIQAWAAKRDPVPLTLVTSDLISALAADAEGLETLYFSATGPGSADLEREFLLEQVAEMILMSAIISEKIVLKTKERDYEFTGAWTGKTAHEWILDMVQMQIITESKS